MIAVQKVSKIPQVYYGINNFHYIFPVFTRSWLYRAQNHFLGKFHLGTILLVGKYYIFHENDEKKFWGPKKKCPFKIQDGAQNQAKNEIL